MKNKINILHISLYFLLLATLAACRKDLGNYSYADPGTATITTDMSRVDPAVVVSNDSIVLRQNDSLYVSILVSLTKPEHELAYEWMVTQTEPSASNPAQYIVGREKQLRTRITLAPNLYRLVVRVTDKVTKVSFYKFYNLNIQPAPWGGEGWLVLQDQPTKGGADISLISSRDGLVRGTVYSDLYQKANLYKLPVGTNKIAVLNYGNQLRIQKVAFYYPNGGIQVRSIDYSDSSNHTSWFSIQPSAFNIESNAVGPISGQYECIINNGQLYYQSVNTVTIKTPPIKFGAPLEGSWPALSPYFMLNANGGYGTFYDKVNRCFLHLNLSNNTLIPTTQPDLPNLHWPAYSGGIANLHPVTGRGYDLNNIGLDLVYAENARMTDGSINQPVFYCIFRNTANDSTFLYQFTSGSTGILNNNTTGRYFLKDAETHVPGINNAALFAVPAFSVTMTSGVFYYVPGKHKNQIYVCQPGYTGTMPATTTAYPGYSFPAGTVIKAMKVFKSGYNAASVPGTEGKVLVVATDETANGKGHNVYFFHLTNTWEISSTPAQVYSGFDKIVDIAFKKGLGL